MLRDTITRQRGTLVGGTEIDWSSPTTASYAAEVFSPTSDEDVNMMQRVSAQYVCQTVAEADIVPTDRILWKSDVYEIASGIDKLSAHGQIRQLKLLLRRITGG